MSWAKIEDRFAEHPKFETAGPLAIIIQVRAICYATRYRTNGFIPVSILPQLIRGFDRIGLFTGSHTGEDAHEQDWAATMVKAELWDAADHGWMVHDYLDYNPSKKEVVKLQKDRSRAGKIGAENKWKSDKSIHETSPKTDANTDWLAALKANPIYAHVDWERELAKMKVWQSKPANRKRQITQSFVINWVNKIEPPLSNGHAVQPLHCTLCKKDYPDPAALKTHNFLYHPKYEG